MLNKRVVITGMGVLTPIGNCVETFWNNCKSGKSGAGVITKFDASNLSVQEEIDGDRTGVIIGSGIGGIGTFEKQTRVLIGKGPRRVSPFFIPMMIADLAAGEVAIRFQAKGPNFCTVSACASGGHAIGEAFKTLQRGDADVMITGGTEAPITPLAVAGFTNMRALSRRNDDPSSASRPFDKNRDGFVIGEGAGILILEELNHAAKRDAPILAEIIGYGATCDAFHITSPSPGGEGAVRSMKAALEDGDVSPEKIDYINAHGTSTLPNDKNETAAIKTLFGQHAHNIAISSTKSMIGHLLGASGSVEFVASILTIMNNTIHPTINYHTPDPECDLNYIPGKMVEKTVDYAISNSFGFGGHNVTLLATKYKE
ncbi:MAG: beta-ketoacyl-[acyl-carrier-protein] synthase II [Candidatus Cloacimonetes bacterium 4572_55]|nr:MAG: beta-ketoacyl-[acyl-carrier-protein] synthase II [Candidatus Cloacimonetes bacterium 4572_55]